MLNNNILFPIRFMPSANFFIHQVVVHDVGKETLLSNIGRYHFNSNFRPLVHVFRCCICTHYEIPISRLSAYLPIALPKSMVMMWCQNIQSNGKDFVMQNHPGNFRYIILRYLFLCLVNYITLLYFRVYVDTYIYLALQQQQRSQSMNSRDRVINTVNLEQTLNYT